MSDDLDLHVYITHFVPPSKYKIAHKILDFIKPRLTFNYLRSWARLLKHGTRGHQPWKTDIMTKIRESDQLNRSLYLARVLQSISDLKTKNTYVNIITNSDEAKKEFMAFGFSIPIAFYVFPKYNKMNFLNNSPWLEDYENSPWNLVWEHKEILRRDFLNSRKNNLYLYLENDMLFTQSNLEYWLSNRNKLREFGLIPSFLRVEYNMDSDNWVAIDQFHEKQITKLNSPSVDIGDSVFIQPPNPYSAIYLMDDELVEEYVNSAAFYPSSSKDLIWWDMGARASMGVQFLNVPNGFTSRHVIEVKPPKVQSGSLIHHLPNLYTKKLQNSENYTSIDKLFKL